MSKTIILLNNDKYNNKKIKEIVDKELINKLNSYKDKIDILHNNNEWDSAKKLGNDYELIYLPNKKNKIDSIALYQPLSRSYFKLWEIIHDFKLLNDTKKYNILCLAEGPGGFIEAIINYRNKFKISDDINAITLKSTKKDIPGWKKSKTFLQNNKNINITFGTDNTGNLYNIENIKYLKTKFYNSIDFITADGGFDYSTNFNKQEEMSYKIIFCEIVAALSTQKTGGTFVCKIFDSFTFITIRFMFLLFTFYDKVYITKPFTSRPANSEKYIVCTGFKYIDDSYLNLLYTYIENWDSHKKNILSFIDLPYIFVKRIKIFNNILTNKQINNIEKTINLNNNLNDKNQQILLEEQIKKAVSWCNLYNITINKFSNYIE